MFSNQVVRPHSLQRQLLIWLFALSVPLLIIGTISSYYRATYFANSAYDSALFRAALALADQIEVSKGKVIVDLPQIAKDLLEYDKDDIIYYCIRDPEGHLVTGLEELPISKTLPKPGHHLFYDSKLNGEDLRVVAFALPLEGTSAHGVATVFVAETLAKRMLITDEVIATMLLPQILIAVFTGIMLSIGIKRGLAPLDKLRAAFSRRSLQDLSPVTESTAPLELQPLLHAMNDLMHRLREAISKQQRFVADASHQLRTPLAGLKTQAEIALRADNPEQIQHALLQIQTSSSNLAQMVSQLLSLARAEPEAAESIVFSPIDIIKLTQTITSEWVPLAINKNIDLGFHIQNEETHVETISNIISGNSILLKELLNNLIDNAIRYTQNAGTVTVKIENSLDTITLSVIDNGQGIAEENRERVFERFYRVLGTGQEGCGLGLTIVREISLRHGARLNLSFADESKKTGTIVSVSFKKLTLS